MTDPIIGLLDLADVRAVFADARSAVDQALRHPALRRNGGLVAAELGLRDAVASAQLEGHGYELEPVRTGIVTDPVVQGALRVSQALDGLTAQWSRAPRQVLAKLHVLAARDVVGVDELGRPNSDAAASGRLDMLATLVTGGTNAPATLVAAIVHGELLALGAFAGPNGVVARGAARLALMAGGFDPRGLVAVDIGHLQRGPEYFGAASAFATGTRDGIRSWLKHYASALTVAAEQIGEVGNDFLS